MIRYYHNTDKFWLKDFSHIKNNFYVKRQALASTTFIVYTITLSKQDNKLIIKHPLLGKEDYELFFGQYIAPQQNLSLIKNVYFDYDVSINTANAYDSKNKYREGYTQTYETQTTFSYKEFFKRLGLDTDIDKQTTALPNYYTLSLGYSKVRNYKPKYESNVGYEAISSDVVATLNKSCFDWVQVKDNKLIDLKEKDLVSSTKVLDYKLDINFKIIDEWLTTNFSDLSLFTLLNTDDVDISFIFYPPSTSGLQLRDVPNITSPMSLLKTKVITRVVFEVPQSLITNAQKLFEVYFTDKVDDTLLYKDSSLYNPNKFTMKSKGQVVKLKPFILEPNLFEDLSTTKYPNSSFIVEYAIDRELTAYLASNLNYKITVRVSDLTSTRD